MSRADLHLSSEPHSGIERRDPATMSNPPRLVLRFGAYLATGLALAAAGILLFVRHSNTEQAEASARERAQLVASVAMPLGLDGNLERPLTGGRRTALDRLFASEINRGRILSAAVYNAAGERVYSLGRPSVKHEPATALRDEQVTGSASAARATERGKRLVIYTPVVPKGGRSGVLVLEQDYAPIARAARDAFLPIAGVLQVVLVVLFVLFIPVLRRITHRVRAQMRLIEHQALHDDLTDLPNRALLNDRIEQVLIAAERHGRRFSVMLMDLDRFKEINDTLGHHAGDLLLQEIAQRLRRTVRAGDTVARLGGDEFAVLSPETGDVASAIGLAERIQQAIQAPLRLDGHNLDVEASIGIALYPDHGDSADKLLKNADFAMYAAKQRGSTYEIYAAPEEPSTPAQIGLLGDFRRAVDERELVVHFQPAADLGSGRLSTVEALVRWRHPRRGLLLPSEFVPAVEQTSLIRQLTLEVLDQALRQQRQWIDEGFDLNVAVNLSPRSLQDPSFIEELERLLHTWGVAPARLDLEITESTIIPNPRRAIEALEELRRLGVGLVLDDFGTGYSSLTFLRKLPVDTIKIDRSFVVNMARSESDRVIVRSLVDLAHNLDMRVIAEGVEDAPVWEALAALGCDAAQGYYLSRPLSGADLTEWLRAGRRAPLTAVAGEAVA